MTLTNLSWNTALEKEFIDRLGRHGHTLKLGRLAALRAYAQALARRKDWTNIRVGEIRDYLYTAIRRAEQEERIESFRT